MKIAGAGKLAGSIAENASFIILHKAAKSLSAKQKTLTDGETVFKLIEYREVATSVIGVVSDPIVWASEVARSLAKELTPRLRPLHVRRITGV